MSELSDLLNAANVHEWSLRSIEAQARQRGHKLSYSAYSKYMNGKHGIPSEEALRAFSDIFHVKMEDLRAAAHLPTYAEPFVLPSEASRLTKGQRDAVLHVVKAMLEESAQSNGKRHTEPETNDIHKLRPASQEARLDEKIEEYDLAAYAPGGKSMKRRQTDKQDEEAEGSQDPDDYEGE